MCSLYQVHEVLVRKRYVNSILEKEKLNAELQSLKAQVHPHFLFNTLNNIYGVVENTSPQGSDMILRLSALLRYILYECNNPFIRLGQEFKIIHDYIALERARYSDTLDLQVELPGNVDGCLIAPLLLLPLVENCFKHGTSRVLEHPLDQYPGKPERQRSQHQADERQARSCYC